MVKCKINLFSNLCDFALVIILSFIICVLEYTTIVRLRKCKHIHSSTSTSTSISYIYVMWSWNVLYVYESIGIWHIRLVQLLFDFNLFYTHLYICVYILYSVIHTYILPHSHKCIFSNTILTFQMNNWFARMMLFCF